MYEAKGYIHQPMLVYEFGSEIFISYHFMVLCTDYEEDLWKYCRKWK